MRFHLTPAAYRRWLLPVVRRGRPARINHKRRLHGGRLALPRLRRLHLAGRALPGGRLALPLRLPLQRGLWCTQRLLRKTRQDGGAHHVAEGGRGPLLWPPTGPERRKRRVPVPTCRPCRLAPRRIQATAARGRRQCARTPRGGVTSSPLPLPVLALILRRFLPVQWRMLAPRTTLWHQPTSRLCGRLSSSTARPHPTVRMAPSHCHHLLASAGWRERLTPGVPHGSAWRSTRWLSLLPVRVAQRRGTAANVPARRRPGGTSRTTMLFFCCRP